MPIIKTVPKEPCTCPGKPNPNLYGVGTIWECDDRYCKRHWELLSSGRIDPIQYWAKIPDYNEPLPNKRITAKQVR